MRRLWIAVAVTALAVPASAQQFEIDSAHSHIGFGVRHMTVSTVRGEFTEFDAALQYDAEDPTNSSVEVTIDTSSINTRQDQRDNHLRSGDFLDAENHPQITFTSTSIEGTEDGFAVTGDLTIRGTTHQVVLPVEVAGPITDSMGEQRLGVSGEITIDRNDYNVAWSRVLEGGGLVVGNDVRITIEGEFTHNPEPPSEAGR